MRRGYSATTRGPLGRRDQLALFESHLPYRQTSGQSLATITVRLELDRSRSGPSCPVPQLRRQSSNFTEFLGHLFKASGCQNGGLLCLRNPSREHGVSIPLSLEQRFGVRILDLNPVSFAETCGTFRQLSLGLAHLLLDH